MTVNSTEARNEYISAAAQTIFNFTFKIFVATDLAVYVTPAGQAPNDSADLTTDYVVDPGSIGVDAGGFLTFNTPLNSGDAVTITSDIPLNRTVDYQNNGDFRPDTVNGDNDRQVAQIKQIKEIANKSLVLGQASQNTSGLTVDNPVELKLLRWKSDLSGLENIDVSEIDPDVIANDSLIFGFPTLNSAVVSTDTSIIRVGAALNIAERTTGNGGGAMWDVVLSSTVTEDTFSIVQCTGVPTLSLVLRIDSVITGKEFGVVGGAVTDDYAAMNAAIATGRAMKWEKDSYLFSQNFDIDSNADIDMSNSTVVWKGTVDISNNGRTKGIFTATGVAAGSTDAVLTTISVGDNSSDVADGSIYAVDQWVYMLGATSGDNDTDINPKLSVMARISGISTNTLTVDYVAAFEFAIGTTTIDVVIPKFNINIRNGILDDQQAVSASSTVSERNKAIMFFAPTYCQNIQFKNLSGKNTKFPLVLANKCSDVVWENIEVLDPDWVGGGEGYGLQFGSCLRTSGKKMFSSNTRHCIDFTGGGYHYVKDAYDDSIGVSSFHQHGAFEHNIEWDNCIGDESQVATSGVAFGKQVGRVTWNNCQLNEISGFIEQAYINGGKLGKLGTLQFGKLVTYDVEILSQGVLARDARLASYTPADLLSSLEINGGSMKWTSGSNQFSGLDIVNLDAAKIFAVVVSGIIQIIVADCSTFKANCVFQELGIDFSGSLTNINLDGSEFRVSDPQGSVLLTKGTFTSSEVWYSQIGTRFLLRYDGATVGSTIRPFLFQDDSETLTIMFLSLAYQAIDNTTKAGTVTTGGNFTQSTLPVLEHLSNGAIATVVT